jgi:hypothetical protein
LAEYGFDESVMTIDAPLLQDPDRQVHVVPSLDCLADLRDPAPLAEAQDHNHRARTERT